MGHEISEGWGEGYGGALLWWLRGQGEDELRSNWLRSLGSRLRLPLPALPALALTLSSRRNMEATPCLSQDRYRNGKQRGLACGLRALT